MSEYRSPRDRLRAIRAGRVSQLLDPEPTDGLPPTAPPRLMLNGKPVKTGAAFDAVMARAHSVRIDEALNTIAVKSIDRGTKQFSRTPTTPPPGPLSPAQVAANALTSIWQSNLPGQIARHGPVVLGGLGAAMAMQKNLDFLKRTGQDPWNPSAQSLVESGAVEAPEINPSPQPAEPPKLPQHLVGPDPDLKITEVGQLPPSLAEPPKFPDSTPPNPEEFNQPQILGFTIYEIDWRYFILYHNSSPETEADTRFVLDLMKRVFPQYGIPVIPAADLNRRETEYYIRNLIDNTRKGSAFTDIVAFVELPDGKIGVVTSNTVDTLNDGRTPDWRERRNAEKIDNLLIHIPEQASQIMLYPKSRGWTQEQWAHYITEQVHRHAQIIRDQWFPY